MLEEFGIAMASDVNRGLMHDVVVAVGLEYGLDVWEYPWAPMRIVAKVLKKAYQANIPLDEFVERVRDYQVYMFHVVDYTDCLSAKAPWAFDVAMPFHQAHKFPALYMSPGVDGWEKRVFTKEIVSYGDVLDGVAQESSAHTV